jgi:non-heme chloroperoxidase
MQRAIINGIEIAYFDTYHKINEEAPCIVLVHGFASTAEMNWQFPGWFKTLGDAGYRVIALDNRGHGKSEKLYNPNAYEPHLMAGDVLSLMDHLNIARAHHMGYSMGARIAATLAISNPERIKKLVLGGLGQAMVEGVGDWTPVANALLTENLEEIEDARGLQFRIFADKTKSDKRALAACIQASRQKIDAARVATISTPTLVAIGTEDDIAGSAEYLADLLPNGEAVDIPKRDHMLAVGDAVYKAAVLKFLEE